jgi:glycosyltransferase involved in cell wall biosynthesis
MRALRAAGHEVTVLATEDRLGRPPLPEEDPGVHRELRWYWRDHEFPPLSLRETLALERHNHRVFKRHLADADSVSWWAMGGLSMALIGLPRVPALGWVNDDWLLYGPKVDQWAARKARLRLRPDFERAARWIFCSDVTRQSALRKHALADTAVLHQGVTPEFVRAPEREWEGRLLYAGRIDERKGIGTLIDAVAGLPDMTLRVVGDGDDRTARALRDRAGERVRFDAGVPRSQLARAYAEADAVVFPVEWSEPWGLVPLEAMAVGRPVVATGRGGSAEYLEAERNAVLFEAGDVAALRSALLRLAGDQALRERLREGGFATAGRLTEAAWTAQVVREHEAARSRTASPRR